MMAVPEAMMENRRSSLPVFSRNRQAGDRTELALLAIAFLVLASVFALLFSVTTGASDASILDVVRNMGQNVTPFICRLG